MVRGYSKGNLSGCEQLYFLPGGMSSFLKKVKEFAQGKDLPIGGPQEATGPWQPGHVQMPRGASSVPGSEPNEINPRPVRVNLLNLRIQGPTDIFSPHLVPVSLSNLIAVIWSPPLAPSYSLPTSLNMPCVFLPVCPSRCSPITQRALPHICLWHSPASW